MKRYEGFSFRRVAIVATAAAGALVSCPAQQRPHAPAASAKASAHQAATGRLAIYSWEENAPGWDRKLHISGYRMGCNTGDPEGCVREAGMEVKQHGLARIFLSMAEDPVHTPVDALAYSRLSLTHPYIVEAGMDDFVDRYQNLFSPTFDPRPWLREVIHNVKALNPRLAFGITFYEDELDSPYARPPYLPADLARGVNIVHLFLHYRTDAPNFPRYVDQAQALFPNATIIAGLYAYDRIDYIPCSPSKKRPCSPAEEIHLYQQSAATAAQLLKEGRISGIEFYPGFFGAESRWYGWKHADYCAPARVEQCIDDTRQMRDSTEAIFSAVLGPRFIASR